MRPFLLWIDYIYKSYIYTAQLNINLNESRDEKLGSRQKKCSGDDQ